MSRVKGRNTLPERTVRSLLHGMGYRFRLHRKDLPGVPDIILPKHRKVVFVHGCFWHQHPGCKRASKPTTNTDFWDKKLDLNQERDSRILDELHQAGWQTMVVWECEIKNPERLKEKLSGFLKDADLLEIGSHL